MVFNAFSSTATVLDRFSEKRRGMLSVNCKYPYTYSILGTSPEDKFDFLKGSVGI